MFVHAGELRRAKLHQAIELIHIEFPLRRVGNNPVPSRGVNCPWNVRSILLVEEPVCALEQYVPHSTKKRPNVRELRQETV